ncbi:AAA domain protein [Ceratobasidium sp. AG-Ba]|nr:AAA domain protein [Ceratobasidium sp. AG-Ba]QRW02758.1 AAA domain protein [Ceratobasidium sp. AG-Ba]
MSAPEDSVKPPVVIVLCGLVGSGKSTFASALQREFPEFRRCNQDELGKRRDVENAVHTALSRGLSVCVDRTNIDPDQRRTWIEIARQYPKVEVWGLQMDTPYQTCKERLATRTDHPTIKTPESALQVLSRFARDFVPIDPSEGFNRVYHIPAHHSPDFTCDELEEILASVRAATFYDTSFLIPPTSAAVPPYPSHPRGFYLHPDRGMSQDWRSRSSTPESQLLSSGSGTWMSDPHKGSWRSQNSGARGFGGDSRWSYRGGYGRGRGGWSPSPYGSQSSRDSSPSNYSDRPSPSNRAGRFGGPRTFESQLSVANSGLSRGSTPPVDGNSSIPGPVPSNTQ